MKKDKELIETIMKLNDLIISNHLNGNKRIKRFCQLFMNWIISNKLKTYGYRN